MANIEDDPIISALSQVVHRDGKQIKLAIYGDGEGGWLLEAVDDFGNSTVWQEPFQSEQEALDEALRTIEDEGIGVLIGLRSDGVGLAADVPQPVDEFSDLANFLDIASETAPCMDMPTLEGFLAAIAIGPRLVPPSQWLPWVWDQEQCKDEPEFDSQEQASHILSLLIRKYNSLIDAIDSVSAPFEPAFGHDDQYGAQQWCAGFLHAAVFDEAAWSGLMFTQPGWFTPFMRLGTPEGADITAAAGEAQTWIDAIVPALMRLRAHWRQSPANTPRPWFDDLQGGMPLVRAAPKVGRNDPCPCGSGKKFKRCCGANSNSSQSH